MKSTIPMKITERNERIASFLALLDGSINSLVEAGKLLVSMIEDKPDIFEDILRVAPHIKPTTLDQLELIGRGKLHPILMFDDSPAARRAMSLPYKDQQRVLDHPMAVVSRVDGGFKTEQKRFNEMTREEAVVAIDVRTGHIRKPDEQAAVILEQIQSLQRNNVRYIINGDRVTFFEKVSLGASELEEIVQRLKVESMKQIGPELAKKQIQRSATRA
jgi:hypothetical protein